jgi:hypothetical protein
MSTQPFALTLEQIAVIGDSLQYTRSFYQAEINAGRDLYGNNAAALARNVDAEKAFAAFIHATQGVAS